MHAPSTSSTSSTSSSNKTKTRILAAGAAAAAAAAAAASLLSPSPAGATGPDHCRAETVPGHSNDRITRIFPKGLPSRNRPHKPYYMAGHYKWRIFCSTSNFVRASYFSNAAAVWYTLPAAPHAHKPRDVQFLDGRQTSRVTKQHQLIIELDYTWMLTCSRRPGAITYQAHYRSDINRGPEPAEWTFDNSTTGHGRTHSYRWLCGTHFTT